MSLKDDWDKYKNGILVDEMDEQTLSAEIGIQDVLITVEYRLNLLKEDSLVGHDPILEARIDELESLRDWLENAKWMKGY